MKYRCQQCKFASLSEGRTYLGTLQKGTAYWDQLNYQLGKVNKLSAQYEGKCWKWIPGNLENIERDSKFHLEGNYKTPQLHNMKSPFKDPKYTIIIR